MLYSDSNVCNSKFVWGCNDVGGVQVFMILPHFLYVVITGFRGGIASKTVFVALDLKMSCPFFSLFPRKEVFVLFKELDVYPKQPGTSYGCSQNIQKFVVDVCRSDAEFYSDCVSILFGILYSCVCKIFERSFRYPDIKKEKERKK